LLVGFFYSRRRAQEETPTVIFSKSRDFLFLKGKKVAGTSVEMALSTVCGPDDIITPITPIDELERLRNDGRGAQNYSRFPGKERAYLARLLSASQTELAEIFAPPAQFHHHMSLEKFVKCYGSMPTERMFCVERCPYAKIISSANMANNFSSYKQEGGAMINNLDKIRTVIAEQRPKKALLLCKNIDRYRDREGNLRARVLRHEQLAEDFASLMNEYGISPVPALPHAKQGINSNSVDPRTVFTRQQLNDINEIFAEEFEVFGYERV
jgi:hypothetical protein